MRARLIMRFLVGVRRLDRAAMTPLMDPDFGGPVLTADGSAPRREEMDEVRIPCQLEPDLADKLMLQPVGLASEQRTQFTVLRRDLARLGLMDGATGTCLLRARDRVTALYLKNGNVVRSYPDPPGLFVEEVVERGWGVNMRAPRADLLTLVCAERMQQPGRVA